MWLWDFGRTCNGLDGFDRVRRLVGVVKSHISVFYWQWPLSSLMCKTKHRHADLFEIIWESMAISLAFAMISFTVAARILALASLLWLPCRVFQQR